MADTRKYWTDKEQRAATARKHTENMQLEYSGQIEKAVIDTKIYDTDFKLDANANKNRAEITVINSDTVHAGHLYCNNGKTAILDFASYKNPGGMFINGSKAQEECLCHVSYLYNVLSQFTDKFYKWNNENKNRALYFNRALYSPGILFFDDGENFCCDVIVCAAPNKAAAQRHGKVSVKENTDVLKCRIKFVLDIAADNHVDTLILGAFGCGVFGQDAEEVAGIFKEYLSNAYGCFTKVIFAVPSDKTNNLSTFKKVFMPCLFVTNGE